MAIVTLADAKSHLGIVDNADDVLITSKIDAAQAWLEQMLGYAIEEKFGGDNPVTYPADLVEAVKQIAAHFFENRESTVAGLSILSVPLQVEDTIRNRRTYSWGIDGEV